MRFALLLVTLVIFIGSALAAPAKVFCYYASSASQRFGKGKVLPEDINATLCTHIAYAFAGIDDDGNLAVLNKKFDVEDYGFKRVNGLKQENSNLKVLISVGGPTTGGEVFSAVSADPQKRATFTNSCLTFLQTYNYDGVDIDWEYPEEQDYETYITLLQELKDSLTEGGYLLSAVVHWNPWGPAYNVPEMSRILDLINLKTFDFHSSLVGYTGHFAPMSTYNETAPDNTTRNVAYSIRNWKYDAKSEKILLGVGAYGRTYILESAENNGVGAPASSPAPAGLYTNNEGTLGYNELCEFHSNAQRTYAPYQAAYYLVKDTLWIGYDDPENVAIKVQEAVDLELGGLMIWSIDTDDVFGVNGTKWNLLKTINDKLELYQK